MKLPYLKESNGHRPIPNEITGFLKKLDFKVTFILINETFNLTRLFTFKERQNKLHRSSVVYRITCSCKSTYIDWLDFQKSNYSVKKSRPYFAKQTKQTLLRQIVSKHLTDNPNHKIDFDKTKIMAQTNHCQKLHGSLPANPVNNRRIADALTLKCIFCLLQKSEIIQKCLT